MLLHNRPLHIILFQGIKNQIKRTTLTYQKPWPFCKKMYMIPHQLQIKNFLSYGPETQTIDFANYHLICLSGKNGHGKSAMLDAITWAIWGQARKSSGNSKPDAGLLHLGQKHMMVILEFEVNGQHYRVRREYLNTASKPFATLDFGVRQADGKQIALTDKTIKDTQEKIERTIGITYESFTNSTFLRQGQSNEFSKKSPKERKEILAQILQLQKFEAQKKIAMLHARKLQQDYCSQQSIQERIEKELTDLASVGQEYATVQESLEQLDRFKQTLLTDKKNLISQHQQLAQQLNEQSFLIRQKAELSSNVTTSQQELQQIQETLHQKTTSLQDPAVLQKEEHELHILLEQLQQAHQKKMVLKETYLLSKEKLTELTNTLHQTFSAEKQLLQLQATKYQEAMIHLKKQLLTEQLFYKTLQNDTAQSKEKLNHLVLAAQKLDTIKQQYQQTEDLFEKNKTLYQTICAQGTYLKQQSALLNQQITESHTLQNNTCSTCEQALSPEQKNLVHNKLITQQQQTEEQLTTIKEQAQKLKTELSTQHAALQQLKQEHEQCIQQSAHLQEQTKHHEKIVLQLQSQEQKITAAQQEEQLLTKNIAIIEEKIKLCDLTLEKELQSSQLQELTQTLRTIEEQAKLIVYNAQQHQAAQQKLTEVRTLLAAQVANSDETMQAEQKAQMAQLHKKIESCKKELEAVITKLASFDYLEQLKQNLVKQEQEIENSIANLEMQHRDLLMQKGSLEQKQKKQIALETELSSIGSTIKSLYQEMTDYQEIAKALGKDGIQALLIEQAIPEIEHETNQILARLTNNQTQIFIESLRDLKKGGSRETLDIKISDSFGLRDYEMFSGGEAFRIDFALRIGISKLLARRAGTTLQTIFIDEGFGSQDEEGLQLIMDNIYKIQDDFAKIIIVSHLPEMKEQFPVQFVIEKKRSGSTVSVLHQG